MILRKLHYYPIFSTISLRLWRVGAFGDAKKSANIVWVNNCNLKITAMQLIENENLTSILPINIWRSQALFTSMLYCIKSPPNEYPWAVYYFLCDPIGLGINCLYKTTESFWVKVDDGFLKCLQERGWK